jgi:hypothetical protein
MTEMQITQAFVRKLTKGVREHYGAHVKHTDVLRIVAHAADREPGPMMHALKHPPLGQSEPPAQASTKFYSFSLVVRVLSACRRRDSAQISILSEMLSPDTAFARFALGWAASITAPGMIFAESLVVDAFVEDRMWLRFCASATSACPYPDEMHEFGREAYGENWGSEMRSDLVTDDFRIWATHVAIRYGLIRFVSDRAVFPDADQSPGSEIAKLRAQLASLHAAKAKSLEERQARQKVKAQAADHASMVTESGSAAA